MTARAFFTMMWSDECLRTMAGVPRITLSYSLRCCLGVACGVWGCEYQELSGLSASQPGIDVGYAHASSLSPLLSILGSLTTGSWDQCRYILVYTYEWVVDHRTRQVAASSRARLTLD